MARTNSTASSNYSNEAKSPHIIRRGVQSAESWSVSVNQLETVVEKHIDDLYTAECIVQANLDELNPETLFQKGKGSAAVSSEYVTLTTKLVTKLSSKQNSDLESSDMTLHELEIMILSIIRQLLSVVNYLHNRSIVHRDIRLETVDIFDTNKLMPHDVRVQLKTMHKAVQLTDKSARLYDDLEGLQFCAPEIFNKQVGHGMVVDEYAIGVLAYYLFSGMKDYPCKIPLSLTDDLEICDHLANSQLEFNQPVW